MLELGLGLGLVRGHIGPFAHRCLPVWPMLNAESIYRPRLTADVFTMSSQSHHLTRLPLHVAKLENCDVKLSCDDRNMEDVATLKCCPMEHCSSSRRSVLAERMADIGSDSADGESPGFVSKLSMS